MLACCASFLAQLNSEAMDAPDNNVHELKYRIRAAVPRISIPPHTLADNIIRSILPSADLTLPSSSFGSHIN